MSKDNGVGQFPAGHHQIANELVGRLAHHPQPFHVAQNLPGQIGRAPQLQRLGLVGVGHQRQGHGRHRFVLRVGFQLDDEPVEIEFDHFHRLPKEPGPLLHIKPRRERLR